MGYPDQALEKSSEAVKFAKELSYPLNLAMAQTYAGSLRQRRGERSAAQEFAEAAMTLSLEHGLTDLLAAATIMRGWTISQASTGIDGIAQINEGLASLRTTGSEITRPFFLCLLAEAYNEVGRLDEALSVLTEALTVAEKREDRNYESEIYRLKGELLLRRAAEQITADSPAEAIRSEQRNLPRTDKRLRKPAPSRSVNSNIAEAHRCFEQAIEVAFQQGAKSLELRATISLARLLDKQDHRDQARTMLAEIYHWFTEGFDTKDLLEAKELLEALS